MEFRHGAVLLSGFDRRAYRLLSHQEKVAGAISMVRKLGYPAPEFQDGSEDMNGQLGGIAFYIDDDGKIFRIAAYSTILFKGDADDPVVLQSVIRHETYHFVAEADACEAVMSQYRTDARLQEVISALALRSELSRLASEMDARGWSDNDIYDQIFVMLKEHIRKFSVPLPIAVRVEGRVFSEQEFNPYLRSVFIRDGMAYCLKRTVEVRNAVLRDMLVKKKQLVDEREGESWAYYHQIKFLIDHYNLDAAEADPLRARFMAGMERNLRSYFMDLPKDRRTALWVAWDLRVKEYLKSQGMRPKVSREVL